MKIKLKTGFCELRECELTLDRQALHLTGEGCGIHIPLEQITRFTMTVSGPGPQHFQLEAGDVLYQGRFLRREDGTWLTRQLSQQDSHCVQLIFDP